jgi:hypothetical protein
VVNISERLLKLLGKGGKCEMRGQIGQPVTPGAPPSKSTPTEQGGSKLTPSHIISESRGVHILAHSEEEVGQLGGGAIKILGALHLDCFLGKHVGGGCWGLCGDPCWCNLSL